MGNRVELQTLLATILGSKNVYFQPPEANKIKYPCIVYKLNGVITLFANDVPYSRTKSYTVTVIDKNPDSAIPDKIGQLSKCIFNTFYTVDNLNHTVYTLYY